MTDQSPQNQYSDIEGVLEWPSGFILDLLKPGDDWTFALRLGALVESALTHLISARLHGTSLEEWVADLGLQGRSSKVSMARALGVIDAREERVIGAIARIRNRYAHDPHRMGRPIEDQIDDLDVSQFNQLASDLGEVITVTGHRNEAAWRDFLRDSPSAMLWLAAFVIIVRAWDVRRKNLVGQMLQAMGYSGGVENEGGSSQ